MTTQHVGRLIAEIDAEYNRKTNQLIERHAGQTTQLKQQRDHYRAALERIADFDCQEPLLREKCDCPACIAAGALGDTVGPPPHGEADWADAKAHGEPFSFSGVDGTVTGFIYKGCVYVTDVQIIREDRGP